MAWIFCLFLLFLLCYEPIIGYVQFQKFKEKVKTENGHRLYYYRQIALGLWLPTGVTFLFLFLFDYVAKLDK